MDVRQLESLYDVPPKVLHLVGGCHDGRKVVLHQADWPLRWFMPVPAPIDLGSYATEPDPTVIPGHPAYEYTDSVNDAGERLYRYIGNR